MNEKKNLKHLEIGDKIVCSRGFYSIGGNRTNNVVVTCQPNEIKVIEDISENYVYLDGLVDIAIDELWDYFYSEKELRKIKLKAIESI